MISTLFLYAIVCEFSFYWVIYESDLISRLVWLNKYQFSIHHITTTATTNIIIIIISFSALLSVSYNPSPGFYPRPLVRESRDYMYSTFHPNFCVLLFQSY